MSGGAMLQALGWRPNEPWLQEIVISGGLNWAETGLTHQKTVAQWEALGVRARNGALGPADLPASVLLPQGVGGPAFLAYPNFNVYFEWNQSFTYVLTAAYFATRLEGAQIYNAGTPAPALRLGTMRERVPFLAVEGSAMMAKPPLLMALPRR